MSGDELLDGRHETPVERLDRNWTELLQELRVIQTGVQLLTGFLLTLPFQQRFTRLSHGERAAYLLTAALSVAATVFLQAPVLVHRALYRRHHRQRTVIVAHRMAIVGMLLLGLAILGVTFLITSVVLGTGAAAVVVAVTAALLITLWLLLPLHLRRGTHIESQALRDT
jgi:O-antigen/teichoic acid export membrane protein